MLEDIIYKSLPPLVLALIIGAFKFRDMVMENRHRLKALEQKREADLIEYNSALTMAKSIDAKINEKLTAYFKDATEQRHKDNTDLRETLHKLDNTLTKLDGKLEYLAEDVKNMKNRP